MSEIHKFVEWPKIPRLFRDVTITEKIDGTNASVFIPPGDEPFVDAEGKEWPILVGSRTRWIFPENDNYGFAAWAFNNIDSLKRLGPGHHFGEWWGPGIQRRYTLKERRFSLFNTHRWTPERIKEIDHPQIDAVPVLFTGVLRQTDIDLVCLDLIENGSKADPGFMNPEGIVLYHSASKQNYKFTLDGDGHKG